MLTRRTTAPETRSAIGEASFSPRSPTVVGQVKAGGMESFLSEEDMVKYHGKVVIAISYPTEPGESSSLPQGCPFPFEHGHVMRCFTIVMVTPSEPNRAARAVEPPAQRRRVGRGRKSSVAASAEEPLERSVVKVEKVACLLMRESGFFMAALSTGFKEAKDMALDYHADSEQGESGSEASKGIRCDGAPLRPNAPDRRMTKSLVLLLPLSECEDLQLLLRLMQAGRGYLKDGDVAPFEPRQLLRLAVLGGKVQVPGCVAQCAAALGANMTCEDAAELLTCMPGEMDVLQEIRALRHKALDVLVAATERRDIEANRELGAKLCACLAGMIEGASQEGEGEGEGAREVEARVWRGMANLLRRGALGLGDDVVARLGQAVAAYLGPIHKLWRPGRRLSVCWSDGLSARVKVSAIPKPLFLPVLGEPERASADGSSCLSGRAAEGAEVGAAKRGPAAGLRERRLRAGQWVGRLPAQA
jgi:hypothetical protein